MVRFFFAFKVDIKLNFNLFMSSVIWGRSICGDENQTLHLYDLKTNLQNHFLYNSNLSL